MLKIQTNNGTPAELDTSEASEEEIQILILRAERNSLLQESDKYMSTDFPTDKKNEWEIYRQSLRDMDFSDPDNITWPTKPTE
tara:strand:- start:36 stop:284 length:249 start_codon:yes stop_codon:yes gene_type:complete